MSQFRHRWLVEWNGQEYEIMTTARDMRALKIDTDDDGNPVMSPVQMMCVFHAAMLRLGIEGIPSDENAFLDLFDDMTDLEPGGAIGADPTPRALSAT